jgi:hypothetical protein
VGAKGTQMEGFSFRFHPYLSWPLLLPLQQGENFLPSVPPFSSPSPHHPQVPPSPADQGGGLAGWELAHVLPLPLYVPPGTIIKRKLQKT